MLKPGQDFRLTLHYSQGVLEMGGQRSIGGDHSPFILQHARLRRTDEQHGLDTQSHAHSQEHPPARRSDVQNLRRFMQLSPMPCPLYWRVR